MSNISDFITALNNLHIPIVLIVAAILFIIISLSGGDLKGVIQIPPISRGQRIAFGTIGGIFFLLGFMIAVVPSTPMTTPTSNLIPTNFNITEIKLNNGQILQEGQQIQVSKSPLTIDGTYSTKGSSQVWVVVQDKYGKFYLQNPPVEFTDNGQWIASNIITAVGVTKINFVWVTSQGNSEFQQMIATGPSGFTLLPKGYQILKDIPIQVIQG